MASRSRKRRRADGARAAAVSEPSPVEPVEPVEPPDTMSRGYARGRERDEMIREGLEPLAPGERPGAVTIAAIVALVFAIANVIAALAGAELSSEQSDPATVSAVTTAILAVAAIGMWLRQYWAVLGFQVILALQIIVLSLALVRVEKWWLGLGMAVAIGLLTWLFWKLIRAMARLQMPDRSGPRPRESTH